MRQHVVNALALIVEQRDDRGERNQLGEGASPGLAGAHLAAILRDDFDGQGHLAEGLPARGGQQGVIAHGDEEAGDGAEDRRRGRGGAAAGRHGHTDDEADNHVHEVEDETVDDVADQAPPDAGDVERGAVDAGLHVEQLLGLARGAVRLPLNFDQTVAAERGAAARTASNAHRHVHVIATDHEFTLCSTDGFRDAAIVAERREVPHEVFPADRLFFQSQFVAIERRHFFHQVVTCLR